MLPEYQNEWDSIEQYDEQHPNTRKTDFIIPRNANLGWKVHLNVTPVNVVEVSSYLKENGFNHKYLSGGELVDGKVFTVYMGSFGLVTNLSKQLSQDIGNLLAKPRTIDEVEFAPGVVGRFVAQHGRGEKESPVQFGYYTNTCGFVWTDELWSKFSEFAHFGNDDPEYKNKLAKMRTNGEQESFRKLQKTFGDYFYNDSIAGVPWL